MDADSMTAKERGAEEIISDFGFLLFLKLAHLSTINPQPNRDLDFNFLLSAFQLFHISPGGRS